ncbi:MAG: hypothetical protein NTU74_00230 [Deltaproteobacteria bacterium]|nr:hypothetical protein [Deltaproteobacteria bacterium]
MIYEYAVDPSFFTNEDKACFIIESFGRDKGRLVSEIKKDHWANVVRDTIRISNNAPIARHRLKEALIILGKKKALYCRQKLVENGDWRSQTDNMHKSWPYRGILVEQYSGSENHILVRDITLFDKENWAAPPSIVVEREAEKMVTAVSSLLENAREVMLVDRNFKLENQQGSPVSKYKNVLICFLKYLENKKYGPPVGKLTYHLGQNGVTEITKSVISHLEDQCNRHLRIMIPQNIRLEIAVWPWNKLHDRFLLTEIGGIDFGIGLDEDAGTNEKTVRLKRLSDADHAQEWSKFKQKQPDLILP